MFEIRDQALKTKPRAFAFVIGIIQLSFKYIAVIYTLIIHICKCPFLRVLAGTRFYPILIFASLILYRFSLAFSLCVRLSIFSCLLAFCISCFCRMLIHILYSFSTLY